MKLKILTVFELNNHTAANLILQFKKTFMIYNIIKYMSLKYLLHQLHTLMFFFYYYTLYIFSIYLTDVIHFFFRFYANIKTI